ncbi:MAG: Na/Pi symporter, partial [Clostridiales bacterium]|nr:Na/Pi symporter [Clostridiales bacterium]
MDLFEAIVKLLAGLGVLMVGMKMLSEGLERSAGGGMRKLFGKISNNRFAGIGVGAVATVLVNSSAATTVMVIGFVNAGLMTLLQAASIIMGANIGTTLT